MSNKNYRIAIPSYMRPQTLRDKTLKVLQEYKMDPHKIDIFVANEDQKKVYESAIPKSAYARLIVGKPGIKNIRNFMPNYYPEGKHVFYMDDDISHIYECINMGDVSSKKDNKLQRLPSLKKFIDRAFKQSEKSGMTNWGVYPVENPYFMKPTQSNDHVSTRLCYNIGYMTGVINNRKAEIRTIDDKEDYERSIKYYLKDDGLLRFNNITCRTRCYKEPGGMQVERTKKRIHDSAVYLTKMYPELCSLNTSKKSGYTEVRLRDTTKTMAKKSATPKKKKSATAKKKKSVKKKKQK